MPFDVLSPVEKDVIAQRFANGEETAKLFAPQVFRNDKKASGYFF